MITGWIFWLTVAVVLAIVEILSQMVWTLCLAIGCVGALAVSLLGGGTAFQISVVAIVAVVAYIVLVPFFKRLHHQADRRDGRELRTGMDALIGRTATVVKAIEPGGMGRVTADGDNWQAVGRHPDDMFAIGDKVRIHSYDSIILTVEKI